MAGIHASTYMNPIFIQEQEILPLPTPKRSGKKKHRELMSNSIRLSGGRTYKSPLPMCEKSQPTLTRLPSKAHEMGRRGGQPPKRFGFNKSE
jgi:hypothetical protein